ncbi:hypothetical protein BDZ89DRAFT_1085048 [Hymenopellis radicata]|nr:hypothetical protein BDZ89DRAFT_1085048 [Hymenopellis radicata]
MSTQPAGPAVLSAAAVVENNVEAANGPPPPTIVSSPFSWPARTSHNRQLPPTQPSSSTIGSRCSSLRLSSSGPSSPSSCSCFCSDILRRRSAFEFPRTPLHRTSPFINAPFHARRVIVEFPVEISHSLTSRCVRPSFISADLFQINLFLSGTASGSRSRLSFVCDGSGTTQRALQNAQRHLYCKLDTTICLQARW